MCHSDMTADCHNEVWEQDWAVPLHKCLMAWKDIEEECGKGGFGF